MLQKVKWPQFIVACVAPFLAGYFIGGMDLSAVGAFLACLCLMPLIILIHLD